MYFSYIILQKEKSDIRCKTIRLIESIIGTLRCKLFFRFRLEVWTFAPKTKQSPKEIRCVG